MLMHETCAMDTLHTVPQAALAKAPGNLRADEATLKPILRELNYKKQHR